MSINENPGWQAGASDETKSSIISESNDTSAFLFLQQTNTPGSVIQERHLRDELAEIERSFHPNFEGLGVQS
jgi:hypothetical protein